MKELSRGQRVARLTKVGKQTSIKEDDSWGAEGGKLIKKEENDIKKEEEM